MTRELGSSSSAERTLLGHPTGLYVLFLTEMWERFSFYGMRVLLVLYLTQHFLFTDDESVQIFGSYAALTTAAPILGGIVADRYIGHRKAVIVGAVLLTLGHACMAFEGGAARSLVGPAGELTVERDPLAVRTLFLALALIVVGVGFLKANITALVSALYANDDPRRDSGFTIFQMGISGGAMVAAILCGYLGQTFGWRYGFGVAGIGMMAGLFIFIRGQSYLRDPGGSKPSGPRFERSWPTYLGASVAILMTYALLQHTTAVGVVLGAMSIFVFGGLFAFSMLNKDVVEREKMFAALVYLGFIVLFFVLIEQAGTSLVLFADRNLDLTFLSGELQPSQVFAFLPGSVIILAPIFAWLWVALARRNRNPSTPTKCAVGLVFGALAFVALSYGAMNSGPDGMVSISWLILAYVFFAIGDLWIAPIALSIVTKLTVPKMVGMMVGAYLLAVSVGSYFAAVVAKIAGSDDLQTQKLSPEVTLQGFTTLFMILAAGGIVSAVVLFLISPILKKRMHGLH